MHGEGGTPAWKKHCHWGLRRRYASQRVILGPHNNVMTIDGGDGNGVDFGVFADVSTENGNGGSTVWPLCPPKGTAPSARTGVTERCTTAGHLE